MTIKKKGKLKRRVAIIIVLCMLMNEHIAGLPTTLMAIADESVETVEFDNDGEISTEATTQSEIENNAKETKTDSDTDNSSSSVQESSMSESSSTSEGGTQTENSSITEESSSTTEGTTQIESSEETENEAATTQITNEETESTDESLIQTETTTIYDTSVETEESSTTEAITEENSTEESSSDESQNSTESETVNESQTETVSETETDTINETELTTEVETETETELGTENETETEILFEEEIADALQEGEENTGLPSNVSEYLEKISNNQTIFYINDEQDFRDIQNLCTNNEVKGFEGITLKITRPVGDTWSINSISGFEGIGTSDNPFKGTLISEYGINDVVFNINKPIIAYMGDGAIIQNMRINSSDSIAAIAGNIKATDKGVTISGIHITGNIGTGDGTVGIIASTIESGSKVNLSDVHTYYGTQRLTEVTGNITGGIAGVAGNNVTISVDEQVSLSVDENGGEIAVHGKDAVGGYFGEVKGKYVLDLDYHGDEIKIRPVGNGPSAYSGQIVGRLLSDGTTAGELQLINGTSINANIGGQGNGGGLVGICKPNTKITKPTGNFTISGTISLSSGSSGGVVGVLETPDFADNQSWLEQYTVSASVKNNVAGGIVGTIQGGNTILQKNTVSGAVNGTDAAGGMIGVVTGNVNENVKIIVSTPTVSNAVNASTIAGGIVGDVSGVTAIELQGVVNVSSFPASGTYKGIIVGKQEKCLIYLSESGEAGTNQMSSWAGSSEKEIGTYGGVYRNQDIGSKKLIGDGTIANVGVINHTVTLTDGWYQMGTTADFEALAIVLGTEGVFASNVFQGYTSSYDLLTASYRVTADVDISYNLTGIVTLSRNDKIDVKGADVTTYAFCGKMCGPENGKVTITQSISKKHSYGGLFSTVKGAVEFSNLAIAGTVENVSGVGGIAFEYSGSGQGCALTLNNFETRKVFNNNTGFIAGVIGRKVSGGSFGLYADNIVLASVLNSSDRRTSGFISQLTKGHIDIDGVTLGGSININNNDSNVGGFFGQNWNNISGTIKNVIVQPNTSYTATGTFGVLWDYLSNNASDGKYVTLDTVKLAGLTVNASSDKYNCSLLVRDATHLVANIIDYDSTGCVVNNPGSNFDEVAGATESWYLAKMQIESGIVSLHSRKAYFPEYHYENKVESLKGKTNSWTIILL